MKMESSKEVEGLVLCMRRGLRLGGRHVGEEGQLTWLGAPSSTTICPSCLCSPPSPSLGTNRTIGESKTLRFSFLPTSPAPPSHSMLPDSGGYCPVFSGICGAPLVPRFPAIRGRDLI